MLPSGRLNCKLWECPSDEHLTTIKAFPPETQHPHNTCCATVPEVRMYTITDLFPPCCRIHSSSAVTKGLVYIKNCINYSLCVHMWQVPCTKTSQRNKRFVFSLEQQTRQEWPHTELWHSRMSHALSGKIHTVWKHLSCQISWACKAMFWAFLYNIAPDVYACTARWLLLSMEQAHMLVTFPVVGMRPGMLLALVWGCDLHWQKLPVHAS